MDYKLLFRLALMGGALAGIVCFARRAPEGPSTQSYWLWAGITENDLPKDADGFFYVYQGNIENRDGRAVLNRKGLFAYPMGRREIGIVYRISELVEPQEVVGIFRSAAKAWEGHGVKVSVLQLDYDCPTSRIGAYAAYVERLRAALPSSYALSVTGLGDWLSNGDREALDRLGRAANDVTFQLYNGREPLPDMDRYSKLLARVAFPFHVGLLASERPPAWLAFYRENFYYRGATYFIQK
ncbi:MAG: DUF3142 domain-containing protein [Alphaproteobacteria bacterium]|nr:DUF3142 domain-containing protein [Alphaproteobacteria bacterium]